MLHSSFPSSQEAVEYFGKFVRGLSVAPNGKILPPKMRLVRQIRRQKNRNLGVSLFRPSRLATAPLGSMRAAASLCLPRFLLTRSNL